MNWQTWPPMTTIWKKPRKQFEAVWRASPTSSRRWSDWAESICKARPARRPWLRCERATKLDANDEVAWYRLAQAERAAGNREAQQKALETFRALHASSSAAHKPPR